MSVIILFWLKVFRRYECGSSERAQALQKRLLCYDGNIIVNNTQLMMYDYWLKMRKYERSYKKDS